MISNPKWVFFIVFTYVFIALLGAVVDGTIGVYEDTAIERLVEGDMVAKFAGIVQICTYNYDWLSGTWGYFKLVLAIPGLLFALYVAKEAADFLRGR